MIMRGDVWVSSIEKKIAEHEKYQKRGFLKPKRIVIKGETIS